MERFADSPPVGDGLEVTRRFTQDEYDEFARLSGDDNPIHVDPGFAARTRFGRTVAHGMFLFGVLAAEAARWLNSPLRVLDQRLRFSAPTFTDEDVVVRLEIVEHRTGTVVISQTMVRQDGVQTLDGMAVLAGEFLPLDGESSASFDPAGEFRGLRVGMQAEATRAFIAADIEGYRALVNDPNPILGRVLEVPSALIGGEVSRLLGVELPGPGTNWLKQRYRFIGPVAVGDALTTTVEIARLRPEKALVDLRVMAHVAGVSVMEGETLVLAADAALR